MDKIVVNEFKNPKLNSPVLIGGLPGIGNVGKIAAEYLIEKLKMTKLLDMFSQYFPPQVFINDKGETLLARNSIYYKKFRGKKDLMILVGDFQGTTQEGQYELSHYVMEVANRYNVSKVYTLGGYSTGKMIEEPRVLGAVTNTDLLPLLMENGVVFPKGEPGGGIVGSAGVLLGIAKEIFQVEGACLMGETSGYFADPKGAMELLRVLKGLLSLDINLDDLEDRSKQLDEITGKMQEDMQQKPQNRDDLGYFG